MYHRWLVDYKGIDKSAIPMDAYHKVTPGMEIPYPSGRTWRVLLERGSRKSRRANLCDVDANEAVVTAAEEWLESELIEQRQAMRDGVMFACMITAANPLMAASVHKKFKKKRKRTKAVGTGKDAAPANIREASEHPECELWMIDETSGLQAGVFPIEVDITEQNRALLSRTARML